jgi:hypothetical protein
MATAKQKEAARRNLVKARQAQRDRAHAKDGPRPVSGLRTAEESRMDADEFAFPRERKEPLMDAGHVRDAIARFDQVEGVSDGERDEAWQRILAAAKRYDVEVSAHDVEVSAHDWRELSHGGKTTNF